MPTRDPLSDALMSAGVNLNRSKAGLRTGLTPELDAYIRSSADEIGVPHDIALRQLNQESGFRSSATSPKGARGVAQFMPATAKRFGVDVNDPYSSVDGWKKYMGFLLNRYSGRMDHALAGYNAGEGNVDKYGGIPPFQETQDYVRKIMGGSTPSQNPRGRRRITSEDPLTQALKSAGVKIDQKPIQRAAQPKPFDAGVGAAINTNIPDPKINPPKPSFETDKWGEVRAGNPSIWDRTKRIISETIPDYAASAYHSFAQGGGQALGSTLGTIGMLSNPFPGAMLGQSPIESYLSGEEKAIKAQASEEQYQQESDPNEVMPRLGRSIARGAGSAAVEVPKLILGGALLRGLGTAASLGRVGQYALEASNLPSQMGLTGLHEGGVKQGLIKTGEGLVYHFGMGITAPLGWWKNGLIWGGAAGAQTAVEQKLRGEQLDPTEIASSSLQMGIFSAVGSEKVRLIDPKTGETRPAGMRDYISLQRGTWKDGKPIEIVPPEYIKPYIMAFRDQAKDPDVLSSNRVRAAQQRIDELRERRESVMRGTRPLADQAVEQLAEKLTPYQFNVVNSHLEKLSDGDRLWQVISIQNQLARGIAPEQLRLEYQPDASEGQIDRHPDIHTFDDIKRIALGEGDVQLYHGGPKASLESLAAGNPRQYKDPQEMATAIAKAYGIPLYEFLNKTGAGQLVNSYGYGQRPDKLSTAPPAIARRWMDSFPMGEVFSSLDGYARLYSEAKRQGVPWDDFYESAPIGDTYRAADQLGLPSKFEDIRAKGSALAQVTVDARAVPKFYRDKARRLIDAVAAGKLTVDEAVHTWNTNFKDIKISPQHIKSVINKTQIEGEGANARYVPNDEPEFESYEPPEPLKNSKFYPILSKPDLIPNELKLVPEFSHLSDYGRDRMVMGDPETVLHLAAEADAPKIDRSGNLRVVDASMSQDRRLLEKLAKNPELYRVAKRIEDIVDSIKGDLSGYSESYQKVKFAGFSTFEGSFGVNTRGEIYADGNNRIRLNLPSSIAAINALHELGYIDRSEFADALAQHIVETIYHEMEHQNDPASGIAQRRNARGVEGHDVDFDNRYHWLLAQQADNVLKYTQRIKETLLEKNEAATNELAQSALSLGHWDRLKRYIDAQTASGYITRAKGAVSSVNLGRSPETRTESREDASGRSNDYAGFDADEGSAGEYSYPLYKREIRESLVKWAKSRKNNLDRFMGNRSIFKKNDGSYFPVYHGSTADIDQFKSRTVGRDIGFHFSETPEGAADRLRQKSASADKLPAISVKGEGYERRASRKEVISKQKLLKGESYKLQQGTNVLPVYLKLENPIELADFDQTASPKRLAADLIQQEIITPDEAKSATSMDQLKELIQSKGYDGIQYNNQYEDPGSKGYIVFEPEQIKSAIGNSGEFDPHDPNILHAEDPISLAIKGTIEAGKLLYKAGAKFVDWSRDMIDKFGPGIKLHLENIWEAVVKMNRNESGQFDLGTSQFVHQDIAPKVRSAVTGAVRYWDVILKHLAPAARGIEAWKMAAIGKEYFSGLAIKMFRIEAAIHDLREVTDKLKSNETMQFISDYEAGKYQPQKNNKSGLTPIAELWKRFELVNRASLQRTGKLQSFYEDYFPHLFEDPRAASESIKKLFIMQKRPLEGNKGFLKHRTAVSFLDAVNSPDFPNYDPTRPTLRLKFDNLADMMLYNTFQVQKYVMAHDLKQETKSNGQIEYVKANEINARKKVGWDELDSSIFTVFGGASSKPQGGQLIRGKYMAPEQAARVINNYLSPGLADNPAFRGFRFIANTLNQFQLGWSLFHAGFTTIDAVTSRLALAAEYGSSGMPLKAAKKMPLSIVGAIGGKAVAGRPGMAIGGLAGLAIDVGRNVYTGHQVMKESMRPGSTNAKYAQIVDLLTKGGFRPKMDKQYTNDVYQSMRRAFRSGNLPGGVLRLPFAVTEAVAKPVLEQLVPRQKLGIAADLVRLELDKNSNMDIWEQRKTMGKIWDSVDNRMGQMTYDNLFWNKTAKDLAMFSVRSVGWNLGTFREIGGGIYDTAGALDRTMAKLAGKDKGSILTHRMAYAAIALPFYTALLGAITQYLYTGDGPKEAKDYFFPRTGAFDERGNPERVNLPTYVKDIYHYRDAVGLPPGPHTRKTLMSKLHPMLAMIGNMLANEDYYGTEIHGEDDSWPQRRLDDAKYVGKSILPFGIQNFMKEQERGQSVRKSLIPILTGITPAPSDINETAAEEELYQYNQNSRPAGTRTKIEADRSKLLFQIRASLLRNQSARATQLTKQGVKDGIITVDDLSDVVSTLSTTPLQKRFSSTDPEEAIKAWGLMKPEEKDQVRELMIKKIDNVLELPPIRRDKLIPKYKQALQYYRVGANMK